MAQPFTIKEKVYELFSFDCVGENQKYDCF